MSERKKLEAAVDAFAVAMKARLLSKLKQGWSGWDDPHQRAGIADRLLKNASQARERGDEKSLVDVANLAMMLWMWKRRAGR